MSKQEKVRIPLINVLLSSLLVVGDHSSGNHPIRSRGAVSSDWRDWSTLPPPSPTSPKVPLVPQAFHFPRATSTRLIYLTSLTHLHVFTSSSAA